MARKATTGGETAEEEAAAAAGPSSEAARDLDAVSEQLDVLRRDVTVLIEMLGDLAGSGARESREAVERRAEEYIRKGRERADEAVSKARALEGELEAKITRNPLSAVLIALGLGYVFGQMSRR